MKKGMTKSGFEFEIDEKCLDDMRMLEAISESMDNPLLFPKVFTMLLGKEQKERLYKHLEDENGRVPTAAVSAELNAIFSEMGNTGKNF